MAASDKYSALLEVDIESDTRIDIAAFRAELDAVIAKFGTGKSHLVVSETPGRESDDEDTSFHFGHNAKGPKVGRTSSGIGFTIAKQPDPPPPEPRDYGPSVLETGADKYKRHLTLLDISEDGDTTTTIRTPPKGLAVWVPMEPSKAEKHSKGRGGQYDLLFEHSGYGGSDPIESYPAQGRKGGKTVDRRTGLPSFESKDGDWRAEWEWPSSGEKGLALTLCSAAKHGWEALDTKSEIANATDSNDHLRDLAYDLFKKLKRVPISDDHQACNVFDKWASEQEHPKRTAEAK